MPSNLPEAAKDPMLPVLDEALVVADGRRIGYRVRGDRTGQVLVYFHGQPGSRLEADLIPDFEMSRLGITIISFDRPGMGNSDLITAQDITVDVEDAVRLTDHLGIDRFAVMGTSAGGPPALALTAIHPERVERTVLCSASGPYDDERYMSLEDVEGRRQFIENGAESMLGDYATEREEFLVNPESKVAEWFAAFPEDERAWITRPPAGPLVVADYVEAMRQGPRGWLREAEVRLMS
jgi:pimeloyl-ACP methyl ester carboxylesterase